MVGDAAPQVWRWPRVVAAAGLVCALAGLLALGDGKPARYAAADEGCAYTALLADGQEPPALLVMGSSRAAHGFAPDVAGARLPDGRIIALGREFRGVGHVHATLADIPAGQWPAQLVLEFDPTAQSARNPAMEKLAPLLLLLEEAQISHANTYDALADGVRLITLRLADGVAHVPRMLAGDTPTDPASPRIIDCVKHRDRTDAVALAAARGKTPAADHDLGDDGTIPDAREAYWLGRIIAMSEQHGAQLTLLHIPQYGQPPLPPRWRRAFAAAHGGVPYLAPRGRVLQQMQASGYANPNHLNPRGAETLTQWLIDELARKP